MYLKMIIYNFFLDISMLFLVSNTPNNNNTKIVIKEKLLHTWIFRIVENIAKISVFDLFKFRSDR